MPKISTKGSEKVGISEDQEIAKNITFQRNHALIVEHVTAYLKDNKKIPSHETLAKLTGLSTKAIWRHFKNLKFEPSTDIARSLSPKVTLAIFRSAMSGQVGAQKLWKQLMDGWSEKADFTLSGDLNIKVGVEDEPEPFD